MGSIALKYSKASAGELSITSYFKKLLRPHALQYSYLNPLDYRAG